MAEPTGGLTFQDLIIRVAEYLGVADYSGGAAAVPTDAHDLELCKRMVNDGIRLFIQESVHPMTGRPFQWRWMRKLYSLTITNAVSALQVDGDTGRYFMPEDFNGDATGRWTFGPDENVYPEIDTIPEDAIRRWRSQQQDHTGFPRYAAFRPLPEADWPASTRARWEVIFFPSPGQEYVVQVPYRVYFTALVNLTDRSPAGAEHDATIEAAAKACAELDRDDKPGGWSRMYQSRLLNSITLDTMAAPRTVGQNLDRSGGPEITSRRQLGYSRPVLPVNYNLP